MKNLKMPISNLKVTISAFVLISFNCSFVRLPDQPKTGIYDIGAIAVDKSNNIITGYISDGVGDPSYGAPERTCFVYFSGKIKDSIIEVDLWEFPGTTEIKKYKAELSSDPKMKENFILKANYIPNYGICSSSTFSKEKSKFTTSMLLVKECKWIKIYLIKVSKTLVFMDKNENSKVLESLDLQVPVKVLLEEGNWLKIEMNNGVSGWIEGTNVYDTTRK